MAEKCELCGKSVDKTFECEGKKTCCQKCHDKNKKEEKPTTCEFC